MKKMMLAMVIALFSSGAFAQNSTHYEYAFPEKGQSTKVIVKHIALRWSEENKCFSYTVMYVATQPAKITFRILLFNKDGSIMDDLHNGPTVTRATTSSWSSSANLPYKPSDAVLEIDIDNPASDPLPSTILFNRTLNLLVHEKSY